MFNVEPRPKIGQQMHTSALVNSFQPTPRSAVLVSVLGMNTGPDQWIQIWDATGPTDSGAVLLFPFAVAGGKSFSLDTPVQCARGILLVNGSAAVSANPTASPGAADCWLLTRHLVSDYAAN